MKKLFFFMLIAFLMDLSCAQKEKSGDGIQMDDIILLNETQVTNFISFLPEILKFSDQFYAGLTREEKEGADANDKFFKALAKDKAIGKTVKEYGFSNTGEMILAYKNIVLEYTTVTRDFTNFTKDMENLKYTIESYRSNYTIGLNDKNLSGDDKKVLLFRLQGLEDDEKRYSNIILIKKYEKRIDEAYQNYYGKK